MGEERSYCCPICGARAIECAEIAMAEDGGAEFPYSLGFDCAGYYGLETPGCSTMLVVTWRDLSSPPIVQSGPCILDRTIDASVKMGWELAAFERAKAIGDLFGLLPDGFLEAKRWAAAVSNGAAA